MIGFLFGFRLQKGFVCCGPSQLQGQCWRILKLCIYKIILQYIQSIPKISSPPNIDSPLSWLPIFPSFPLNPIQKMRQSKDITIKLTMQSSKLISKAKQADLSINKKAASTLRKKLSVMDPTPPLDIEQSYLQFSMKSKREVMQKRAKCQEVAKDVYMTPNNKIYNTKNTKYVEPGLDASIHQERGMKGVVLRVGEMDIRPRSSNTDKYQKSIEIHNINEVKPDSRPGSSKSSRLFRKKGSTVANDDMKTDNDQDDSFIKVTTRQRNSAVVRQRQRIGTSLSKKTRGGLDKFQSKLDPEFFNLFAS